MSNEGWFERERLHLAAQDGDLAQVKRLIAEGLDVNAFDELGNTPLHWAAMKEHLEVAAFLIEAGADVNAHDEAQIGNTPLAEIAGNCSLAMARLLVDAGADPTIRGWMQMNALDRSKRRKHGEGPRVHALLAETARRKRS
ncbi:MAG: ankyrin repeat domain-containing protein [Isosphaeraceae bacterium]